MQPSFSPSAIPAASMVSAYRERLQEAMQAVGITSQRELLQRAGISRWPVRQLLSGRVLRIRVEVLVKLSQTLETPVSELVQKFSDARMPHGAISSSEQTLAALQQEYDRLLQTQQQQLDRQKQEFQQAAMQILETLLINLPTALYAAQQNPQLPATRLAPLLKPIDQLLQSWGVEPLHAVGDMVVYDPHIHETIEGSAMPGQMVRVRYVGYRQGDRLLHRAKVSP